MIYSMNPFKWLLWLCQKIRWRKSTSKKGYKVVKDRLRIHATGMIKYKGVPFYYLSCFCDRGIGESCEACHPDNPNTHHPDNPNRGKND